MSNLSLRDDTTFWFENEFDRIFYGDKIFASCFIQILEHSYERCWFTWTCWSSHQIQSFLCRKNIFFDAISDIRKDKLFKFFCHSIDFSHNHSDSSCLEKCIHSIRYAVFWYISKISFLISEEFIESLRVALKQLSKDDFHRFIAEFTCSFFSDDFSIHSIGNTFSSW